MTIGEIKRGYPPKIIWMLWLQGWETAPLIARACRKTWENRNSGWVVQALDLANIGDFLPKAIVESMLATPKQPEALSDQIRLELLHRYGGVWADATTMCAVPLDDWLADAMPCGFFAFARPGPDRMVSTWFLAAEKGSYMLGQWRSAAAEYWAGRTERDHYFWVHRLFAAVYDADPCFRELWDETPEISAAHPFHFGPNSAELLAPAPAGLDDLLKNPPAPVFKLTHKFESEPAEDSLFASLCRRAENLPVVGRPVRRRLLVGWYGSFAGHGTIGDLRSLEAIVSHLVGRGHEVLHATADPVEIAGATRADWRQFAAQAGDVVLFVCGPILRNHAETSAFFAQFCAVPLVGVGVSLMEAGESRILQPVWRTVCTAGGRAALWRYCHLSAASAARPSACAASG